MSETIYKVRRKYPSLSGGQLTQIRRGIEEAFEGGKIENYEIDPNFLGSDQFDAHLHSAAVARGATIILTSNREDLLPENRNADELPYEIYTPDEFFILLDDSASEIVREVISKQLEYFMKKHQEVDLPGRLREAMAPQFALRVAQHLQTIPLPRMK